MVLDNLKQILVRLRRKLNNPKDKDDPRWVKRWIAHIEGRIAKKESGAESKLLDKNKHRRVKSRISSKKSYD